MGESGQFSQHSNKAMGSTTEELEFNSLQEQEIFSSHSIHTSSVAHSASNTMGTGGVVSPGVKQQGQETDCSLPSNAKFKNGRAIPLLPICLNGMCN
jgi:hypothetical protein